MTEIRSTKFGAVMRGGALCGAALLALACSDKKSETKPEATPEVKPEAKPDPKPDKPAPTLVAVGADAPDFTSEAHDGTTVQISKLKGQPVVLYFYPKDDTPG